MLPLRLQAGSSSEHCICDAQAEQKDKASRPDIDAVINGHDRTMGFFVAFDCKSDPLREIDVFSRSSGDAIISLAVRVILEEEIARKVA